MAARLMASFSEIIDQVKFTILTTGLVNRPALFCCQIDGVGGRGRGHCVFDSQSAGMTEDDRSVVSFNEIFDQQKIATLTTGVVNRPVLFVIRLLAWQSVLWGMVFVIHGGLEWQNMTDQWQVLINQLTT